MNILNNEINEFFGAANILSSTLINSSHSNFHIYMKDRNGKLLGGNDQQAISVGLKKGDELKGFNDFDFVHSADANILRANDERVIKQNCSVIITEKCNLFNKNQMTVISTKLPLHGNSKKVLGIIGLSVILAQEPSSLIADNNLTKRQLDCAFHLVLGCTLKEIAANLKISPKTAEHHIDSIKNKLDCYTRSELIKKILKISIIQERLKAVNL